MVSGQKQKKKSYDLGYISLALLRLNQLSAYIFFIKLGSFQGEEDRQSDLYRVQRGCGAIKKSKGRTPQ